MKILLVHKFFHITGGAEVFFFETSRVLKEQGHEVAFLSTASEKNVRSKDLAYFVNAPDFRGTGLLNKFTSLAKIIYSFEAKNKMRELIQDFKPDVVHIFAMFTHLSPSILDACHEAGVPVVLSCNDYKHICPNYKLYHHGKVCEDCKNGQFYMAVKNRCCQNSLTFSTASCLESYVHHALDILRKNIHTFLFSGDFMAKKTEEFWGKDTFRWDKLANPYNSSQYPLCREYDDYILFFGRFVEEKGADVLLKAMAKIPEVNLVMVGDGPQGEDLQQLADDLSLKNVKFTGPLWGEDLDSLIKKSRFVVVPSTWHENFPYVIFQAFAFGKAVIGTDRGGIPELVLHGKRGLIYPALDVEALAENIIKLWRTPELSVEMGEAAKKYIDKEFTDEKFYENLTRIYREAIQ
jgi:glycosyltransferase involved in cell wall biosynthesis